MWVGDSFNKQRDLLMNSVPGGHKMRIFPHRPPKTYIEGQSYTVQMLSRTPKSLEAVPLKWLLVWE